MRFETIEEPASHHAHVAARHLAGGGLLAHPTSGVYGIGGIRDRALEEVLHELKGRPPGKGLVYLVADRAHASREFPEARWSEAAERLARAFWPGALTLVLPDATPGGVAVRAEPHPVTRAVVKALGAAVSSTSLNLAGEAAAHTGDAARRVMADLPPVTRATLLLDCGILAGPPPSTLVRVAGSEIEVLRQGALGEEEIRKALA